MHHVASWIPFRLHIMRDAFEGKDIPYVSQRAAWAQGGPRSRHRAVPVRTPDLQRAGFRLGE